MKNTIVSLLFVFAISIYGCSSDDATGENNANQQAADEAVGLSQAETMEDIWASTLEPAEKARRVQELLARSSN